MSVDPVTIMKMLQRLFWDNVTGERKPLVVNSRGSDLFFGHRSSEKVWPATLEPGRVLFIAPSMVDERCHLRHTAADLGSRQTRGHTFVRSTGAGPGSQRAATFRDLTSHGQQYSVGLSSRSRLNGTIYRNTPDLANYLDCIEHGRSPVHEIFPLDASGSRLRYIALTLGEGAPLDPADYHRTFGTNFEDDFAEPLHLTRQAGLIAPHPPTSHPGDPTPTTYALTSEAKLVYDKVLLAFYPTEVKQWLKDRENSAVARGRMQPVPSTQS